ncbi:MAG: hypothetical protein ACLSXM_09295 [Turicibacter sanguinis]
MGFFTNREVRTVCKFASDMVGNHAPNMIMNRQHWEIFKDDISGKLGEVALEKYIRQELQDFNIDVGVDYTIMPRGEWDITDLIINGKKIQVKTIGKSSNYLMIECLRYDENGNFTYNNNNGDPVTVDAYVLVRIVISPAIDEIDFNNRNHPNFINLFRDRGPNKRTIEYEVLGAIDHQSFWESKHFAPAGIKCIGRNLRKIDNGDTDYENLEFPDINTPPNNVLQQDNYILSSAKLNRVNDVL